MSQDMKSKLVASLLEFIYLGAAHIEQSDLNDFMKMAESLQIKGIGDSDSDTHFPFNSQTPLRSSIKRRLDSEDSQNKFTDTHSYDDITDETENDDENHFQINSSPEVANVELRFDKNTIKPPEIQPPTCSLKISSAQSLNQLSSYDSNSHLNNINDIQINGTNKEVPDGGSRITMLTANSLLHENCVFNRNNIVATQAGLKTYWLCKSYRISTCKARCITFKGQVISATGSHNHHPHTYNEIPPGHTPNYLLASQTSELLANSSNNLHQASSQHTQNYSSPVSKTSQSPAQASQFKKEIV